MKQNRESGSLVAIIIIVLFVSLMATLGVIFYQNFISKPPRSQTTTDNSDTKKNTMDKTARVAFQNTIYAVDYPGRGWNLNPKSSESGSYIVLTTADNKVQVSLEVSPIQAKDTCDTTDGLQVSSYNVSPNPVVTKLTDKPLYLVEAMTDAPGGGYRYAIGLVPDGGETHASVGVSHCEVASVGMASPLIMSGSVVQQPAITAIITFPGLPKGMEAASSDMQTIKDLMATDGYKCPLAQES